MKQPVVNLSTEDALVLQQISESGEEDVVSLTQTLGMHRQRILASLERLRQKGLIKIKRTADDWWIYLSTKGKNLSSYVWPEMTPAAMI